MLKTTFSKPLVFFREIKNDLLISVVILVGLSLLSMVSKLLFHVVAELFSIMIGLAIFLITWNTRKITQNEFLKFFGIAFFWIACLDFVHLITYKGMNIIPGLMTDVPTQFWIAARYIQALSFLLALFPNLYKQKLGRIFWMYGFAFLGITLFIFLGWFPSCHVEGVGLTPFKIYSEYAIILLSLSAGWLLWTGKNPDYEVFKGWILISILFSVFAEMFFTQYIGVFDVANIIGHFFKFLAFFALYRGMVEYALKQPVVSLFNDLNQTNLALEAEIERRKQSETEIEFLAMVQKNISDAVISTDLRDKITFWNKAAEEMYGWSQEAVLGKNIFELLKIRIVDVSFQDVKVALESKGDWEGSLEEKTKFGEKLFVQVKISKLYGAEGQVQGVVGIVRDITREKKENERLKIRLLLEERINYMPENDLIRLGLNEAVQLLESEFGFFHFYDLQSDEIKIAVWSDKVYEVCNVKERSEFSLSECGVWADSLRSMKVVVHNDYHTEKRKTGLPFGHVPIMRDVSVPVVDKNSTPQGVFGVANKEFIYDQSDIEILQTLGQDLWEIITEKRVMAALQKSEERFRKYFELPLVGVGILDSEFRWIDVNEYLLNTLGFSRSSLMNLTVGELFTENPFSQNGDEIHTIVAIETKARHRSGKLIDIELSAQAVFGTQGMIDYYLIQLKNISDWKLDQQLVQIQNDRLTKLQVLHQEVRTKADLLNVGNLMLDILKEDLGFVSAVLLFEKEEKLGLSSAKVLAQIGFDGWEDEARQALLKDLLPLENKIKQTSDWLMGAMETVFSLNQQAILNKSGQFVSYLGIPVKQKNRVMGWLNLFFDKHLEKHNISSAFISSVVDHLVLLVDDYYTFQDLSYKVSYYKQAYEDTIAAWANTAVITKTHFIQHSSRELDVMNRLVKRMLLSETKADTIKKGVILHNIGYYALPETLILKTDPLEAHEWQLIRQHPIYALKILSSVEALKPALEIPVYHHEHWDGGGYPYGLAGEDIPLTARMFALVDVWDALLSERPYRSAWQEADVLAYIQEQSGKQFDPNLVPVFLELLKEKEK